MIDSQFVKKIEYTVVEVTEKINDMRSDIDWKESNEYDLWYELVACILGSNVKFEHARSFACHLHALDLLNLENINKDYNLFELKISRALSHPILFFSGDVIRKQKYRFPILKANHIRKTAESLYENGNSIRKTLSQYNNPSIVRYQLTMKASGVGLKQASLFLRNIGYADDLAILDTHVLNYMLLLKLISHIQKRISKLVDYEKTESILQRYAKSLGIQLSCLDTAIWVVMRVYQREFQQ